jgi:hypothetical protein
MIRPAALNDASCLAAIAIEVWLNGSVANFDAIREAASVTRVK